MLSSTISDPDSTDQWESLPVDVVFLILDKLLEPIDHVSFGVVCKEWCRLAKDYNHSTQRWRKGNICPMLLIPRKRLPNKGGRSKKGRTKHKGVMYSISQGKIYSHIQSIHFRIPTMPKKDGSTFRYYHGCGHGWLAIIDAVIVNYTSIITLTLFNPFTKVELASLPPLMNCSSTLKVILSDDPTLNPDNYMIIVMFSKFYDHFDFIKGGQSWRRITYKPENNDGNRSIFYLFTDVIFYKGRVYVAESYEGRVVCFDFNGKQQVFRQTKKALLKKALEAFKRIKTSYADRAYLVESTKGDLLYVRRYLEHGETKEFRVYKLVFNGSIVEHVEVYNIGDEALFVGDNQSVSVLASSSLAGCQPNCIYFTDDFVNFQLFSGGEEKIYGVGTKWDMGIFNLGEGSITQHYPRNPFAGKVHVPPPLWIIPQFKGLCALV